jgi:glutamyl-tRNA synthetase
LGGARTALFNWLYARHTGGQFVLRVEDTDHGRNNEASMDAIIEGMAWLGMHADEPMVIQSQQVEQHKAHAARLLDEGKAYRCYCSSERIEKVREDAMAEGRKPKYDGHCRNRTDQPADEPFVVRFKTPPDGETSFDDIVLGTVSVSNEELDDLIILRTDGSPTYNFVVVCDDGDMAITHVVRGQDHVSNTYRQVHMYHALGFALPAFAHLPMIEGLSKRKGSASVMKYRDDGYHPEAVINYLSRLGWSHGDQELFEIKELIELFDLKDVNRASGKFDDTKLEWVNEQWMKRLSDDELARRVTPYLPEGWATGNDARIVALVPMLRDRSKTLVEFATKARFAFEDPTESDFDDKAVAKHLKNEFKPAFEALISGLEALTTFDIESVSAAVAAVVEATGIGMGKLAQPVRIGLTGGVVSPSIHETVAVVGQQVSVRRLNAILPLFHD